MNQGIRVLLFVIIGIVTLGGLASGLLAIWFWVLSIREAGVGWIDRSARHLRDNGLVQHYRNQTSRYGVAFGVCCLVAVLLRLLVGHLPTG